jgi:outer membrane autotransporter protein
VLNGFSLGNPIYDQIVTMTEEEARAAFDALSGEAYGSASNAAAGAVQQIRDVLQARIQSFAGGSQFSSVDYAPAAGDVLPGDPPAVWGQVFGSRGVNDASAGAAKLKRRSWGFLAGSDRPVGEVSRIGVAVGYSRSDFDVSARSSSGDSNNFHLAGYGSTQLGVVDFAGTFSYTYGDAEAERTVIVGGLTNDLSASYGTHTVQASVEAATDIGMISVVLTPFAGLAGAYVRTESFTETGGPAALTVEASNNTTGITSLGLRLRHQAGKVTLTGSSAWRHAFGDVDPSSRMAFASTPASSFTVRGTPVSEDTLALGAQIRLGLDEGVDLSFGYSGEFATDARDQGLNAVVRVAF